MAHREECLRLAGMHCAGCEVAVESALTSLPGVLTAEADQASGLVRVRFDETRVRLSQVIAAIEDAGYNVVLDAAPLPGVHPGWRPFGRGIVTLLLLLAVGGIVFWGKSLMPGLMAQMHSPDVGYAMILLVGFLTGFHCIGMCGSFVVSYAAPASRYRGDLALRHLAYGGGKTLSYATLGAVFGALGALFTLTAFLRGALAIAAGLYLVLYGLRLLGWCAGPAWLNWAFPKAVMRGVQTGMRAQPRPWVIGLLNGFLLGCGPLQAMYILAAGTGSPLEGALLLMFFGLGTLGPLLGFGVFAHLLSQRLLYEMLRVSGILVLLMGLLMTDRGLRLTESGFDLATLRGHWRTLMQHDTAAGDHGGH